MTKIKYQHFSEQLEVLKEKNNFRTLKKIKADGKYIFHEEKKLLNCSSNDYLGIADDKNLLMEFYQSLGNEMYFPYSSNSSRLLSGNNEEYDKIETLLASQYAREACLLFNSGYHANTGIIPAICDRNTLIIADRFVHASILDGIKISNARYLRYNHLDYEHLEKLITEHGDHYRQILVISESVFSMDGDNADLRELILLKKKYSFYLYIDEAHAVGVSGNKGLGLCEEQNSINDIDFIVGTFGKAYSSVGAYLICDKLIKDFLINKSRTLIYTTALPPLNLKWTHFIAKKMESFSDKRNSLMRLSIYFKNELKNTGFDVRGNSQIIPVIIGANKKCIEISEFFENNGYYVPAVKPPTVPEGTARLRFSLQASFDKHDIDDIIILLKS
ncbi:MAG: 8-amino-7-oxononanoate synthase [Bacteroidetes bacterium RIFOXYA12_FULL_35_11]|nr:MAG: 8-amino-7-oxononanoate synthase [Bacteroidetes bacterium GWF2_35_48]OFY83570.1 MAG: 8-amino-7-oxononanoate synthase [Bacteroidetes bacterium RIFOXYA12_FULL_35_11]OFY97560.1 MAG: 8-amino-7-oxononanoate synthase [Bacteroidetes bacterium RIFOXYB2_FULL_35_7]OFZ01178.1 MAG: 8-amino-7-oxononanoate synthase [Bacteroidetes bacterium RIFOXYC12_FULL_35_7]